MKISKLFLIFCGLLTFMNLKASDQFNFTTITGTLAIEQKQDSIMIYNVVDGQMNLYATTLINEKKQFGFALPITTSGFYLIDYGQMSVSKKDQLIRFYLEPGLDIEIVINEKDYSLSGNNLGHNELVRKANMIYNEFSIYTKLGGRVTFEDFYPFLENKGVKLVKNFINTIKTSDKSFNNLLKLAVQADFESNSYRFFRMPRTKHPENNDNLPVIFDELERKNKFSDPKILNLFNGLGWMEDYFSFLRSKGKMETEKMKFISSSITDIPIDQLKEIYIIKMIQTGRYKADEYKIIIEPLYQYLTSDKSKKFLITYEKELHKNVGQPGFNFTYQDINDKPVSFSDFKGKLVYIDVWATWCGPCMNEIPFLKTLEEEYRDKDIVFLSISIDKMKDKLKWKDMVVSKELQGVQLIADKDFKSGICENYAIKGIPRFLLFDKEGKIVSSDTMRPSNPEIRNQFNNLLNSFKE